MSKNETLTVTEAKHVVWLAESSDHRRLRDLTSPTLVTLLGRFGVPVTEQWVDSQRDSLPTEEDFSSQFYSELQAKLVDSNYMLDPL